MWDQGCFLLENFISIELNVTLTAQNWDWNDNFQVEPMGQRVYCLGPGRYTWTVDAPPPWNEINGEFSIKAGDRLIWPIRAE
jgi:serine protease Do